MHPVKRARRYLAKFPPAIEGEGGDIATYRAACVLVSDFDLSDAEALPLLLEWNRYCVPTWSERDIRKKLTSARRNHARLAGSKLGNSSYRPSPTGGEPEALRNRLSRGYPPRSEVRTLLEATIEVDRDTEAQLWLHRRGIDPARVLDGRLARVIPASATLPRWARGPGGSWTATGHRLVVPLYSAHGELWSVHVRSLNEAEPKTLFPSGFLMRGLLMACSTGRGLYGGRFLDGRSVSEAVQNCRAKVAGADGVGVVVAEGITDFLRAATEWSDADEDVPGTLGITAGSWSHKIAFAIPNGTHVVIATDNDAAGEKYAAKIQRSLAERCRVSRWTP